jgi:regulator of ribonuclease activity A
MTATTSDLYDQFGERLRVLPPLFQDYGGRARFGGEVVTVRCFEDNSRIKELLGTPGVGKVLVVDGGGSLRCALLGDLLAGQAVTNGWEGVVLYGCVRDRVALKALALGIRALGTIPRKSIRRGEGQTQLPIEIGGVACRPGDRLTADEDGIVLLDAQRHLT